MTRRAPEYALHRAVAELLSVVLTEDTLATTFPLGGGGYNHGAKNKRLGAMKGWPDVQLVHRGRFYAIELKAPKGRLNDAQRECHRRIILAGGMVCIARSVEDVLQTLRGYGIPMRIAA